MYVFFQFDALSDSFSDFLFRFFYFEFLRKS